MDKFKSKLIRVHCRPFVNPISVKSIPSKIERHSWCSNCNFHGVNHGYSTNQAYFFWILECLLRVRIRDHIIIEVLSKLKKKKKLF